MRRFFPFPFFVFGIFFICSDAFAGESASQAPVEVHGDVVEYFHEERKVVGTGRVSIDYEGVNLKADKITLYTDTQLAEAEGHVVLSQPGSVFTGERGAYNFKTKTGDVSGMDLVIEPSLYGKARRVEKVSPAHYRATDGYLTTCCGDDPFYKVQARQVEVYPQDKVVVRNALLVVKGVPLLYIPVWVQKLGEFDRFPVQIVPGQNKDWGAFVLSKWRYILADGPSLSSRGNVLLDYRETRGFGWGVENFYREKRLGRGSIKTYSIEDSTPPSGIEPGRYRAQWRHQSKLTNSTTLTTEINKLSDSTLIKDFFFREEYERNSFPDNYVSLITAKPEYTLSLLDRERFDDFFSVVERSPEIRFDTHNRPFGDTSFYLREEYQFSNLRKEFSRSESQLDALRFDTNHTLSYAGRAGPVSVTPHVGTRQTYYSRVAESGADHVRGVFDAGLDLSARFYRIYDATIHAWGLDYNRLRHVFTPTASYNYRPDPTLLRTGLQPFDSLDAVDKQHFIRFGFENKLQTKQMNPDHELEARDIARVIPSFDMNYDTHRIDQVGLDAEFMPYPWLRLEADTTYDTITRDFNTANFDVHFEKGSLGVSAGQRYVQNESSQATANVEWKLSEDVKVGVYERYEFEGNDQQEFEFRIAKAFSCLIAEFTYNHSDGDAFFFVFRLKGYPSASFSLSHTYNAPKTAEGRGMRRYLSRSP